MDISLILHESNMMTDLLAKEEALGRNVNFVSSEGYKVMQTVSDQGIQFVCFDALPCGMRGILQLDKLGFANIRFLGLWVCFWFVCLFLLL